MLNVSSSHFDPKRSSAPLTGCKMPTIPPDRSSPIRYPASRITVPFDMLHVSPPQSPPDEIKSSPLVNAAGWVEVNQNSMQHVRYPNVFSLGDVSSTQGHCPGHWG